MSTAAGKLDHQQVIVRAFDSTSDAIKVSDISSSGATEYLTLIDEPDASTTYVGKAAIGTATTNPSWQIQKISISGTVTTIAWANGASEFDQIWTMRASLTYS